MGIMVYSLLWVGAGFKSSTGVEGGDVNQLGVPELASCQQGPLKDIEDTLAVQWLLDR